METITGHVHLVALAFQVVHQLVGTFYDARLVRTDVEKHVAHLQTKFLGNG